MTHRMDITIEGPGEPEQRTIDLVRTYNLGFTIRDKEKMQRHLDEVEGVEVAWPDRPPIIFPISPWATLTDTDVPVQYASTSGEIEIVTLRDGDEVLVGVGSDHTDRELEKTDVPWAKQVGPNVVSPTFWRWSDVEDHWDEVTLHSWVAAEPGGEEVLYQKGSVAEFWTPIEMLEGVEGRVPDVDGAELFMSGTIVSEGEKLDFGRVFRMRMHDPVTDRTLEHTYTVTVLADEISE